MDQFPVSFLAVAPPTDLCKEQEAQMGIGDGSYLKWLCYQKQSSPSPLFLLVFFQQLCLTLWCISSAHKTSRKLAWQRKAGFP